MKYNLTCIGTQSHQIYSFEECVSGVSECNYQVMERWRKTFRGSLGLVLVDCFTTDLFLKNFSLDMAKLHDGPRIDSGVEEDEFDKFYNKYRSFRIDPATKAIVFSNALDVDRAIELHVFVNGRMLDSYGMGTHLTADVLNKLTGLRFKYSNIVIKLIAMRIDDKHEWDDCVKLSNDEGKTLGDKDKCDYLVKLTNKL